MNSGKRTVATMKMHAFITLRKITQFLIQRTNLNGQERTTVRHRTKTSRGKGLNIGTLSDQRRLEKKKKGRLCYSPAVQYVGVVTYLFILILFILFYLYFF